MIGKLFGIITILLIALGTTPMAYGYHLLPIIRCSDGSIPSNPADCGTVKISIGSSRDIPKKLPPLKLPPNPGRIDLPIR